jgi:hypothetical protein
MPSQFFFKNPCTHTHTIIAGELLVASKSLIDRTGALLAKIKALEGALDKPFEYGIEEALRVIPRCLTLRVLKV